MKKISFLLTIFAQIFGQNSEYATIHKPLHSAHEQFSLSLFCSSFQLNKNSHICPFAIETLLKTLSVGSYKITAYEMRNVLKSSLNLDELIEFQSETIKNLQIALNKGEYQQKNILYLSSDLSLDPNFLLQSQKISPLELVQEDQNKTAGTKIEEWLNSKYKKFFYKFPELSQKETKGKITPISIIDYTLYWKFPFDPLMTSIDSFQYPNEIKVQGIVDMMEQTVETDFYEDDLLQAVEMPLENHLACLIFLPKGEYLNKVVDLLEKPLYLKKIASKMKKSTVAIKFPKIHLDTPVFYKQGLMKIGLTQPFLKLADFRGIDSTHALCLNQPIQICKISFSEAGINTENLIKQKKHPPLKSDKTITVNRPFIFFILDSRDLTIFDSGCYQSPY